jgi:hypothetical protein
LLRQLIPRGIRLSIWRATRRARQLFHRSTTRRTISSSDATFCAGAPSSQTAIDIFQGTWTSAFPSEYHVTAGTLDSFDDVRVRWAAGVLPGGFSGLSILELGPYEAYTTWQFERLGAKKVTTVESSDLNYLKALVVKEVTGLRARMLYGDAAAYLAETTGRFDLVWASGVLYHSTDPVRLLELIARATDTIFLHTHYYDRRIESSSAHAYAFFEPSRNRTARIGDRDRTLHYKAYGQAKRGQFSGGPSDHAYWMEKDDLFAWLRAAGFSDIQVGADDPGNPNGPALFCLARRIS